MKLFKIYHTTTDVLLPELKTNGASIIKARDIDHAKYVCMEACSSYDQNFTIKEIEEIGMEKAGMIYTWITI